MSQAKRDVLMSVEVWTDVLEQYLGNHLVYAYAKGSGMKSWGSPIDYVPILSDVDIHLKLRDKNNQGLFPASKDVFDDSMKLSLAYEEEFLKRSSEHLHVPRSQLVVLDKLTEMVVYVPPKKSQVYPMVGEIPEPVLPEADAIRRIDLQNIYAMEEFIERIPSRVSDRSGLDFWSVIREMTYRVSPAPVRLLSQTHDSPIDLWGLNRSDISRELRNESYGDIAEHYRAYYLAAWNLFLSAFTDLKAFRTTTSQGYYALLKTLQAAKEMER
ncbi:hypothetical protein EU545_04990 [Candidatus Thorarchaeota archaeon]|nr:MAG: hypothetical protein EU545_04990 [Candidatus Thorarchaeota archaeon]